MSVNVETEYLSQLDRKIALLEKELQKFDYEYENGEEDEQPLSDKETKAERVRIGEHIVNDWTGGKENEAIRSEKAHRPVHESSEPQR